MGEEALVSKAQCHPERDFVYAAGMGGKSRALPWEICSSAAEASDAERRREGRAEVSRGRVKLQRTAVKDRTRGADLAQSVR